MNRRLGTAAAVVAACAAAACSGNQSMFNPQGPGARSIASLGWFLFAVCGVVYVLVLGTMFAAIARRRHAGDDSPQMDRRLTRNVTIATVLTAVTLAGLTVATVVAERGLTSRNGPGAVTVAVVGHQWWWEFRYGNQTPSQIVTSANELHVPVGVPVVLKVSSLDVIHSFWVPNLHGKRDLIPGQVTYTWIQADRPGVFRGQCAEFCGYQHANMSFFVVAEPMEKFQEWIQQQRQPATEPATPQQARGRDVFMQSPCVTCHTIRGTDAGSNVGPELTHVASRLSIAAGTLPNTRGHLAGWITNAQSIKPGSRMPPNALEPADLQALLAYVRSLR